MPEKTASQFTVQRLVSENGTSDKLWNYLKDSILLSVANIRVFHDFNVNPPRSWPSDPANVRGRMVATTWRPPLPAFFSSRPTPKARILDRDENSTLCLIHIFLPRSFFGEGVGVNLFPWKMTDAAHGVQYRGAGQEAPQRRPEVPQEAGHRQIWRMGDSPHDHSERIFTPTWNYGIRWV